MSSDDDREHLLLRGRALSPELKREILDRIYRSWLMAPELRLGQLIANAFDAADAPDPFYIEDAAFAERVLQYTQSVKRVTLEYERWLNERVSVRTEVLGGEATFRDSRLAVAVVAGRLRSGDSSVSILKDYPYLTLKDLAFSLRYCALAVLPE